MPTDQFSLAPDSLAYLAPEVLLGKSKSQVADIWSLGALLYELIHKVPPYGLDSFSFEGQARAI